MEESVKKENGKFSDEIKQLVIFLASGAFVKFHKEFLGPSPDIFPGNHLVNLIHHGLHAFISVGIQIILLLWLVRLIIAAVNAALKEMKSRGE